MNHRLHFMFLLVVAGIAIYFYFVYREIRVYDQTIAALRIKVMQMEQKMALLLPPQQKPPQSSPSIQQAGPIEPAGTAPEVADQDDGHCDDDDLHEYELEPEDNDSVTSKEIKDILTHIAEENSSSKATAAAMSVAAVAVDDVCPRSVANDTANGTATATANLTDLSAYSLESLLKLKNDDLKAYLRTRGVTNLKGTKEELANRIQELGQAAAASGK